MAAVNIVGIAVFTHDGRMDGASGTHEVSGKYRWDVVRSQPQSQRRKGEVEVGVKGKPRGTDAATVSSLHVFVVSLGNCVQNIETFTFEGCGEGKHLRDRWCAALRRQFGYLI